MNTTWADSEIQSDIYIWSEFSASASSDWNKQFSGMNWTVWKQNATLVDQILKLA